ncbi:hypothetical protein OG204_28675 [Streptomyces sp. NBC_01387]|uniref:hypothetical protein n=1 Tax=unclassified Streptomyces TaxID=2593676 RepID=UPI0020246680|nr:MULTISPECIES: hypothetical protein [unclassified Streptomyces]MCX4547682.1 hypothetical protein [Streptomyces sp. NBC_01500]WSV53391.1 hypothetical protein OG282_06530 [Streptomyces sp. NBC_01014]
MAGAKPSRKRSFRRKGSPEGQQDGTGPAEGAEASAEPYALRLPEENDHGASALVSSARDDERGRSASLDEAAPFDAVADAVTGAVVQGVQDGPKTGARRLGALKHGIQNGVQKSGRGARAGLAYVVDRVIDIAPRIPVRDLATLRRHFPGLGPEEIADKLVAGAANATSTVGAGIGAAAMLPVPPAIPAEIAAEITGVAAIELKLIAELHEVYGMRPPGNLKDRSTAYLNAWSGERGFDITKPATVNAALGGQMKRELRQQIMKRTFRDLPNLMPFMVGAAVGAAMNRRDTRRVAEKIRKDMRKRQVPWDALPELPPLSRPGKLVPPEDPKGAEHPAPFPPGRNRPDSPRWRARP